MKPILYIKASSLEDVRLNKFVKFLSKKLFSVYFWGWDRIKKKVKIDKVHEKYILSGGGYKNKKLLLYYFIWMIILFFKLLVTNMKEYKIIAINFECALPVFIVSRIKGYKYLYEIYDEFSISYKFPRFIKVILQKIDNMIMKYSSCVIHVDNNRVRYKECRYIVIENTPNDYFEGKERNYGNISYTFAVVGLLNNNRGLNQIIDFANEHGEVNFIVIGRISDKRQLVEIMNMKNMRVYDYMPQNEIFRLIENCCGIFSLYNPEIEINRLAASNKIYDAMMLGIPVITNKEVLNSKFIEENEIGYILNYEYDLSWNILLSEKYLSDVEKIGKKGRNLYLNKYEFSVLVEQRLIGILLE